MKKSRHSGFTLIELMIVVVIIGLLAALAIPRFLTASKKAKLSEPRLVLKALWVGAQTYYSENGCWPTDETPGYNQWVNGGWSQIGFDKPAGSTRFCYAYTNTNPIGSPDDRIAAATGSEHVSEVPTQKPDLSLEAVRVYLTRSGCILVSYDYGNSFQ